MQIEERRGYYDHKHAHDNDLFWNGDFVKQSRHDVSHGNEATSVEGVSHRGKGYRVARVMLRVNEVETTVVGETYVDRVRGTTENFKNFINP